MLLCTVLYKDCILFVLAPVPPHDVNLTASSSTVFEGDTMRVTCCAKGYPEPVIRINGAVLQVNYGNHIDGVYKGCASRNLTTSSVTAGTSLTMYCNVSLVATETCTAMGIGGAQVPQQVVKNCNAALSATVSASTTTLVAGK